MGLLWDSCVDRLDFFRVYEVTNLLTEETHEMQETRRKCEKSQEEEHFKRRESAFLRSGFVKCETSNTESYCNCRKNSWASIQMSLFTFSLLSKSPKEVAEVLHGRKCFPFGLSLTRIVFHEQLVTKCWSSLDRFFSVRPLFSQLCRRTETRPRFCSCKHAVKKQREKAFIQEPIGGTFLVHIFPIPIIFFLGMCIVQIHLQNCSTLGDLRQVLVFLCFGSAKRQ